MAFNLFNKLYVAPDFAYDADVNRINISQRINPNSQGAEIKLAVNDVVSSGFGAKQLMNVSTIDQIIGDEENQHQSLAHFIKHLYDEGTEGRIYCDNDSYIQLFLAWIKFAMPNADVDSAFIVYNLTKQRERMVFPENAHNRTHVATRMVWRAEDTPLNKSQFTTAYNDFNTLQAGHDEVWQSILTAAKEELCIEIQLASYLSGAVDITTTSAKTLRMISKNVYGNVEDIKEYILDNIMTAKVRAMTGVTLNWEDQDWEGTLRASSSDMDFLFSTDLERIQAHNEYRFQNDSLAFGWNQWLIDNTTDDDATDMQLADMIKAAEFIMANEPINTTDVAARNAACTTLINNDIAYQSTSFCYDSEFTREKINTFWIEYIYQMKQADNTAALSKMSHT